MSEKNKVLIIEDHFEQARLMEVLLLRHSSNFSVHIVADAETGLKRLEEEKFDVVVLDYNLPNLNGLETLKIIKKRQLSVPIIMVTGQGDERIAVEAMRQGAHDYIVKSPDHMDLLPRVLTRAVEEQRLSSRLEQSEKRYFALFETASIAIFIANAENFQLLQINKMAEHLLQSLEKDLVNKNFIELCSAKSQKIVADALSHISEKKQINLDNLYLVRSDNRIIPVDLNGSIVKIGDNHVIQLFVRDISEKVKMQRQLLLSRQRLISLFDGITDLISVQDHEYNLVMGNKKYSQVTRQHNEQLVGNKCYKSLFGREQPCENCPAFATYKTGQSHSIEIFHKGRTYLIWTFPMAGLDGKPDFIVEYTKDVTEQKEIEKQLIKSEKLASVGLLSSGIAHELRNPLNIIETARYSIGMELNEKNENVDNKLEMIKKNVRRAAFIIDNLLQFSRHSEFEREKVDIEKLIDTTISLVKKEISQRHIECVLNFKNVPKVYFSIDSLKQVFLNIIMNAFQAMPEGGTLEISSKLSNDGNWVLASFVDSGVGISEENMKHIFTPFFTTKRTKGGTGLGLYLSYSVLKREGGDLIVKSDEKYGSNFTVKLPIAKPGDKPV